MGRFPFAQLGTSLAASAPDLPEAGTLYRGDSLPRPEEEEPSEKRTLVMSSPAARPIAPPSPDPAYAAAGIAGVPTPPVARANNAPPPPPPNESNRPADKRATQ